MGRFQNERKLSTVTGINAKTVGTTNLYTVPTGFTAHITKAIVSCQVATAVTQRPVAGIGVAAGEDDIFSSRALTGFTTTTALYYFANAAKYQSVAAASVIKLGIDNGSNATTHTITVDLYGYLV